MHALKTQNALLKIVSHGRFCSPNSSRLQRERRPEQNRFVFFRDGIVGLGVPQKLITFTVERDGDVFVAADTFLNGFRFLFAIKQSLPGINVFGFMEIAVGEERKAFHADAFENVVTIGDFPRVN